MKLASVLGVGLESGSIEALADEDERPLLRPEVRAGWCRANEPWEGRIAWAYLDTRTKNGVPDPIVTAGIGCAIFSVEAFAALPWEHLDGTPADVAEKVAEWHRLRALGQRLEKPHPASYYRGPLVLPEDEIDALALRRLDVIAHALDARFDAWRSWPAPAQFAACSLAYAVGVDGLTRGYPRLCAAAREQDWTTCAAECAIRGCVPRSAAQRELLLRAARGEGLSW